METCLPLEPKKQGDMVEGFRIMSELGRGAESIIYVAFDPKTKQVKALKHVVKDNPKEQRFLDQAEQEFAVSSKLSTSAVRKVERVIRKKESLLGGVNELWLVMEHVDGVSCEKSPPKYLEDALYIFEQVAIGLKAMHDKGFVHADMKPNNIIVDDKLVARIIDLGQSCKIGTVKQRIQGTPDYIAPEQAFLKAITPKTDVYNLGAAMYWILTRQFVPTALSKGDSLLGSVDPTLLAKPKPPKDINAKVPDQLSDLVLSTVEVDPDDRPEMVLVIDRLNFIRSRLLAERELTKSGSRPRIDVTGGSAVGINGLSGAGGMSGTRGGSTGVPAGRISRDNTPPPVDPGPGISGADD